MTTQPVPADVPRRPASFTRLDTMIVLGSALAALALTWIIFERLTLYSGALGFLLVSFALFAGIYWLVLRDVEDRIAATDRVMAVLVGSAAAVVLVALVSIVGLVVVKGLPGLRPSFFTETLEFVGPLDDASVGGLAHSIVGTLEQVAIAILLSVPLGITTAVFLNEVGGPLARPVRLFVDAMSGVPSIVAGLFIYAVWVVSLGRGFSGFAAGLALSVLMLPTVTRTAEEVLRLVPGGLREASLALGAAEWRTTWSVVLPTARSGLVTAAVLGVARAVGETAPLIMTSFGLSLFNADPFRGAQSSLPLAVFELVRSSASTQVQRAWTGALVLILTVLVLFVSARIIGSGRLRIPRLPRRPRAAEEEVT